MQVKTILNMSDFRLILQQRDGTKIAAFDAKLINLLISDADKESSREMVCDLWEADVWQNQDAAICDLSPYDSASLANQILFFPGDDPEDIFAVMQLAAQKKVVALLILGLHCCAPQLDNDDGDHLPILVIDRSNMDVCQQFAKDQFSGV